MPCAVCACEQGRHEGAAPGRGLGGWRASLVQRVHSACCSALYTALCLHIWVRTAPALAGRPYGLRPVVHRQAWWCQDLGWAPCVRPRGRGSTCTHVPAPARLPMAPQVKELDAKARMLGELTMALQREERARAASQHEATTLRAHLQTLERELRNAQVCLNPAEKACCECPRLDILQVCGDALPCQLHSVTRGSVHADRNGAR